METIKQIPNYIVVGLQLYSNYIVAGEDMDDVKVYTVIHKNDEKEWYSGCYHSSIMNGLSLKKSEMQELADKMNKENN